MDQHYTMIKTFYDGDPSDPFPMCLRDKNVNVPLGVNGVFQLIGREKK